MLGLPQEIPGYNGPCSRLRRMFSSPNVGPGHALRIAPTPPLQPTSASQQEFLGHLESPLSVRRRCLSGCATPQSVPEKLFTRPGRTNRVGAGINNSGARCAEADHGSRCVRCCGDEQVDDVGFSVSCESCAASAAVPGFHIIRVMTPTVLRPVHCVHGEPHDDM